MIRVRVVPWRGRLLAMHVGSYSEAVWEQARAMPGITSIGRLRDGDKAFVGPAEAVAPLLRTLQAARLIAEPEIAGPGAIASAPTPIIDPRLYPYQRDGAAWIRFQLDLYGGAFLADEMGLGKTPQTIVAANVTPDWGTALVVCPAVVRPKWKREIAFWAAEPERWEVTSYNALAAAAKRDELPPRSDLVVLDEIHYCSNDRAQRTQAVAAVTAHRPLVIALTGTPMPARIRDLHSPLNLTYPGRFGSPWLFQKRYCGGHYEEIPNLDRAVWKAEGASHAQELQERLSHLILRRTKDDVALQLPELTRSVIDVEIPREARRQLAVPPNGYEANTLRSGIAEILEALEGFKIDAAAELATDLIAAGRRPLILTLRKASAAKLGRKLRAPFVTGDTPVAMREAILQGAPAAGVATLYSVTTGIDLVNFDCVVFVGLDWLPSNILQGEGRIHRIGQRRGCAAYFLVATGTLDEHVKSRIIDRLDVFSQIMSARGEAEFAADLRGRETEDEILAAIVEAARREST